jgi:hypothetical protein
MIGLISLTSLGLGTALAAYSPHAGLRTATLETWGGIFFIGGLVLLGANLPLFR